MKTTKFIESKCSYGCVLEEELETLERIEIPKELKHMIESSMKPNIHRAICVGYWQALSDVLSIIEEVDGWGKYIGEWARKNMEYLNEILNDDPFEQVADQARQDWVNGE